MPGGGSFGDRPEPFDLPLGISNPERQPKGNMTTEERTAYEAVEQARADGKTVRDACQEVGVSMATYYKHKRRAANGTGRGAKEWGETFEAAAQCEANPAQEQDRLRRTVAAQEAILANLGIFVTVK